MYSPGVRMKYCKFNITQNHMRKKGMKINHSKLTADDVIIRVFKHALHV